MAFRGYRWDRYVWRELAGPTALGLLLWTFVLLMNAFFLVAEKALSKNLGWELTLRMFSYEVPRLLVMSIPLSILMGAMIAVGRLSADHEWTAVQGAGFGPWRLFRPLAIYGLIAMLVSLWVYAELVPRANYAGRKLSGEVIFLSNLASDLRPGVFYTQLPGTVMFVDNISQEQSGRLQGVLIHRAKPHGNFDELILAKSGDLYPLADGSGKLAIDLRDGVLHRYNSLEPESYQTSDFQRYRDELPAHEFLKTVRQDPTRNTLDMGLGELWGEMRAARAEPGLNPRIREIRLLNAGFELNRRIALPVACFIFAVLALPLGLTRARSGKGAAFALSLAVVLLYWVVFTSMGGPMRQGKVPAWVAAWSGNFVVGPWAIWGCWRLWRSRGERQRLWTRFRIALARRRARKGKSTAADVSPAPLPSDQVRAPLADLGGTTTRFIGHLDQYIASRYLRLTFLTLLAAFLIYSIVDLKRLIEGVVKNEQSLTLVFRYFAFALPGMLKLALPISALVGAIVTFTVLARSGEVTAIKASGINLRRALVPILMLTGVYCGVLYLVQEKVTPETNRRAETLKDVILSRAPRTYGMTAGGKWAFGPEGRRLYQFRLYDPDQQRFQGLSVFTIDRSAPRILDHRFSPVARWNGQTWEVEGGWQGSFDARRGTRTLETVDEPVTLSLDPPENFKQREAALTARSSGLEEQMSLEALDEQIRSLSASGYDTTRLQVAYWGKMAQSVTPLVMVLLGLPFAFRVGRRGSLYGVGVALTLVIVYWGTFAVFNALGLETILPPVLAAWTPNVLYGLLGSYLILYIST